MPPVNPTTLAVYQLAENLPLLKKSFAHFAAKNQFKAREVGFDQVQGFDFSGNTLLDLGELMSLLRCFRVVPQCMAEHVIKSEFSRARFHEPVIHADATWEEKEKDAGKLNFREFVEFLVRITPLANGLAFYECDSDEGKAKALMAVFHNASQNPRHDSNLKQLAEALGVKLEPVADGTRAEVRLFECMLRSTYRLAEW